MTIRTDRQRRALAWPEWVNAAACADHPPEWWAPDLDARARHMTPDGLAGARICATACPVAAECQQRATDLHNEDRAGVILAGRYYTVARGNPRAVDITTGRLR